MVYYNHQEKGVVLMDYEFLRKCFPNYTLDMYQGNEPKNHSPSVNGDYFDNYEDMETSGYCQVYHDEAIYGEWAFDPYRIFIGDSRQFGGAVMKFILYTTLVTILLIGNIETTMVFVT